jgi:excisionase family DNA binding protein
MSQDASEILDKKQLSDMLGVSERTIERWVAEGLIPYIRLPKRGAWAEIRFMRSNILKWLMRKEVKPSAVDANREVR